MLFRRPLGQALLCKIPREILHADYLAVNEYCHLSLIVDNATRKLYLKPCNSDDALNMSIGLQEFLGNFQFMEPFKLVLDRGSYFAGKLLKELETRLRFTRNSQFRTLRGVMEQLKLQAGKLSRY